MNVNCTLKHAAWKEYTGESFEFLSLYKHHNMYIFFSPNSPHAPAHFKLLYAYSKIRTFRIVFVWGITVIGKDNSLGCFNNYLFVERTQNLKKTGTSCISGRTPQAHKQFQYGGST